MNDISDRALIVLMAVVGFGSILVAWGGGFVEAEMPWWTESALIGGAVLLVVLIAAGWYFEFWHLDEEAS